MKSRIITAVLALCTFVHFGQADEEDRINRTFRTLKRLPDGTTEVSTALPLVRTLVRLDPEHGEKYFAEYLEKIVPDGPITANRAVMESAQIAFSMNSLFKVVEDATERVKRKLKELKDRGDNISIVDMFEMQMLMNHLAQLSEMSSSVVSASNSAISRMAQNIKS